MSTYPKKLVFDTNVPKTANLAVDPLTIPRDLQECVLACIEAIEHVVKKGGLVTWMMAMKYIPSIVAT